MHRLHSLLLLALVFNITPQAARAADQPQTVRVIYLVSKDREMRDDYKQAVEKAIINVRDWYSNHLGDVTFKLHAPIVEIAKSDQEAAWFYTHENGKNRDDWGYNNSLSEAKRLLNTQLFDPDYIWVIYSDGPGDKGRGGSSVAVLPEDDLLGLIGRHPQQKKIARWVGGLAHELGHAFGLPHPADTKKDYDAIMWAGFYEKYPNGAYFTPDDKSKLFDSPFFFDPTGASAIQNKLYLDKYMHEHGFFAKTAEVAPNNWVERSDQTSAVYHFDEMVRDSSSIFIKDPSRNYIIKIPLQGGMSELTGDSGAHWQNLYKLQKN